MSVRPIRPALDALSAAGACVESAEMRSNSTAVDHAGAQHAHGPSTGAAKLEALILKLIALLLALACLGCGFGIQHIAYVRQKNELGRQLRQKELELRAVTQAYRSLESLAIAKAAEDFRRAGTSPVLAKRTLLKGPTRG